MIAARVDQRHVVPWSDATYHCYYGHDGAYLYQPITKCACTTIKTLLLEFEGLPVPADSWERHQKKFNKFPGIFRYNEEKQRNIFEGRTNTFKFVIVRNPYSRLVSVYEDKIRRPDEYFVDSIKKSAAERGIPLSSPITFPEFVDVVSRQRIRDRNDHWQAQYIEGRFQLIKFDFVGKMESMPSDLVYALERIGAPEALIARANVRTNETGSSLQRWNEISADARKRFVDAFACDFDVLHYPRRLPID